MMYYKGYSIDEETPVQYVGVYVTRWRNEWGQPSIMFTGVEGDEGALLDAAPDLLAACELLAKADDVMQRSDDDPSDVEAYELLCEAIGAARAAIAKAKEANDDD